MRIVPRLSANVNPRVDRVFSRSAEIGAAHYALADRLWPAQAPIAFVTPARSGRAKETSRRLMSAEGARRVSELVATIVPHSRASTDS